MLVIAFGSDNVIDFVRDKMKLSEKRDKILELIEKRDKILELIEKWRPSIVFWKENASVEGGEHIDEEIQKRGWAGLEFYAFRQPTSISKEDRIGKLEPDFRAGKILFSTSGGIACTTCTEAKRREPRRRRPEGRESGCA